MKFDRSPQFQFLSMSFENVDFPGTGKKIGIVGVLLLTDMFGGTPTNISAMFLKENEVEIVTGVNLPMVIKLASQNKETTLAEMARDVEEQGKQAIYRTGKLLEPQKLRKDA